MKPVDQYISSPLMRDSLSVPGLGRTINSVAMPLASILRQAVSDLEYGLSVDSITVCNKKFGVRDSVLGQNQVLPQQVCWNIIGMWAVVSLSEPQNRFYDIASAENIFFGNNVSEASLTKTVNSRCLELAEESLISINLKILNEVLPYALDHHGPGTRRDVLKNASNLKSQNSKRVSGVYYTPSDVADFMVASLLPGEKLIDPACGTGALLLAAAHRLKSQGMLELGILSHLYGIDCDPVAIDLACFVLTSFLYRSSLGISAAQIWHLLRINMAVRDTLSIDYNMLSMQTENDRQGRAQYREEIRNNLQISRTLLPPILTEERNNWGESLMQIFPEVSEGFDFVVGNPPYSDLGNRKDLKVLNERFLTFQDVDITPNTNSFIPFMETMWRFAKQRSKSAMIVPLSVAYNSSSAFVSLRRAFQLVGGKWTFRFFDRTPDSIFGDDIKQRAAIISRDADLATDYSIYTSSLHRWTSRNRQMLFQNLPPVIQTERRIDFFIPKISFSWEKNIYESISNVRGKFANHIQATSNAEYATERVVGVGETAYNFMVLYRGVPKIATSHQSFLCSSPQEADWAYAVLSSRLTYWLWRVEGDAFHVPASFIYRLPFEFSTECATCLQISELGRELWNTAQSTPIHSVNKGKATISFNTNNIEGVLQIDCLLCELFSWPSSYCENLDYFIKQNNAAGRQ